MRPRLPTDRRRLVLLVEDDRDMLAVLRRNLELDGYVVAVAHDGPAGLAAIRDWQPHLVVLDLMLPGMNGYDVLARARASGFDAPVLLLTARHGEAEKVRGFWHGADDYVTKPFSLRSCWHESQRSFVAASKRRREMTIARRGAAGAGRSRST